MQVGKLLIYALFLSSFLLCGCSRPDYADFIEESLNKNNPDFRNLFDTIVIIPRLGCNSCTRDARGHMTYEYLLEGYRLMELE